MVQRQLEEASSTSGSIAWDTLVMASGIVSTSIQVVSQVTVLTQVLGAQQDGFLLAVLSFSASLSEWVTRWTVLANGQGNYPASSPASSAESLCSVGCDHKGQGLHPHGWLEACRKQH